MNKSNESEGAATVMPAAPSDTERGRVVLFDRGFRQDQDWFVTAAPHEDGGEYLHIDTLTALVAALRPTAPSDFSDGALQSAREKAIWKAAQADADRWAGTTWPEPIVVADTTNPQYARGWNNALVACRAARPSPTSSAPAPTDEQILAAATREFPDWREDIQEQFVLRVVRAALASSVPPEQQREHKGLS